MIGNIHIKLAVVQCAKQEFRMTDKLMARINLSVRCHGNVLITGTAAAQALDDTRALLQVYHEVEEIEALSFLAALLHDVNQLFVLLANARQILLADVVSGSRLTGYRLNRQLIKSFVRDG